MRRSLPSRLLGFCHRLAYALLIAGSTWLFAWLPNDLARSAVCRAAFQALNFPVALVSLYLPFEWQAVDIVLGRDLPETFNTSAFLWRNVRTAVPVYLVVFYLPSLVLYMRRRRSGDSRQLETRVPGP
jgi:hypothetical protein